MHVKLNLCQKPEVNGRVHLCPCLSIEITVVKNPEASREKQHLSNISICSANKNKNLPSVKTTPDQTLVLHNTFSDNLSLNEFWTNFYHL